MLAARCTHHEDASAEAACVRCGDFMCRLCGPLEPVALCPRCAVKSTVDWEERGEHGLLRAFVTTLREALASPTRLGRKLHGAGHTLTALVFATLSASIGLVPLSLVAAVPLVSYADPARLGVRSTGMLSVAVSLVLFAFAAATLFALALALYAGLVWLCARVLSVRVRYDLLVRSLSYGSALVAVPVLGPLLSPLAALQAQLAVSALLASSAGRGRATAIVVLSLLALASVVALLLAALLGLSSLAP